MSARDKTVNSQLAQEMVVVSVTATTNIGTGVGTSDTVGVGEDALAVMQAQHMSNAVKSTSS